MHIAYIGLGKMGRNMVERLIQKGYEVSAYDASPEAREGARTLGAWTASSVQELLEHVATPRTVWLMVPHQVVDEVLAALAPHLVPGDTIIEGGNSPFEKTIERARAHEERGIRFLDAGVSGGPGGAREGACIMVGGNIATYSEYKPLFRALSVENGFAYMGKSGAGHFVKMVHNGIEYGMMQAIAEGFDLMRQSDFNLKLTDVAKLYNHGSVIESRLVGWLRSGFELYGEDLAAITGSAKASGEGLWTVETAKKMGVPVAVIEDSVKAREHSQQHPNYQGQILSVMRNQFGGHDAGK
jgi:6-phosphogluconate dehydrogenase